MNDLKLGKIVMHKMRVFAAILASVDLFVRGARETAEFVSTFHREEYGTSA